MSLLDDTARHFDPKFKARTVTRSIGAFFSGAERILQSTSQARGLGSQSRWKHFLIEVLGLRTCSPSSGYRKVGNTYPGVDSLRELLSVAAK